MRSQWTSPAWDSHSHHLTMCVKPSTRGWGVIRSQAGSGGTGVQVKWTSLDLLLWFLPRSNVTAWWGRGRRGVWNEQPCHDAAKPDQTALNSLPQFSVWAAHSVRTNERKGFLGTRRLPSPPLSEGQGRLCRGLAFLCYSLSALGQVCVIRALLFHPLSSPSLSLPFCLCLCLSRSLSFMLPLIFMDINPSSCSRPLKGANYLCLHTVFCSLN